MGLRGRRRGRMKINYSIYGVFFQGSLTRGISVDLNE
jgi:hypothetical protein